MGTSPAPAACKACAPVGQLVGRVQLGLIPGHAVEDVKQRVGLQAGRSGAGVCGNREGWVGGGSPENGQGCRVWQQVVHVKRVAAALAARLRAGAAVAGSWRPPRWQQLPAQRRGAGPPGTWKSSPAAGAAATAGSTTASAAGGRQEGDAARVSAPVHRSSRRHGHHTTCSCIHFPLDPEHAAQALAAEPPLAACQHAGPQPMPAQGRPMPSLRSLPGFVFENNPLSLTVAKQPANTYISQ